MTEEVRYHYTREPSHFLAMLERTEQRGHWYVRHSPCPGLSITSFGISPGGGHLPNDASLVFTEGRMPAVKIGRIMFDLIDLFTPGEAWDPKVYSTNPFMPYQFKEFLDQLFAVLIEDRQRRKQAMTFAA